MQLRKILGGRVRDVGLHQGLYWVRRVWKRVKTDPTEKPTEKPSEKHLPLRQKNRQTFLLDTFSALFRWHTRSVLNYPMLAYPLRLWCQGVKRGPASCMTLCVTRSPTPQANTEGFRSRFLRARRCRADRICVVPRGKMPCAERIFSAASHLHAKLVRLSVVRISFLV